MYEKFHQECRLTVPSKITIMGLRVETGKQPEYEIIGDRLRIKDNWKVQIVYSPFGSNYQVQPSLLEIPCDWEEEFAWNEDYPSKIKVSYHKIPQAVRSNLEELVKTQYFLNLTLEGVIEITFNQSETIHTPTAPQAPVKQEVISPVMCKETTCAALEEIKNEMESLEKRLHDLSQQIEALTEKTILLEDLVNKQNKINSRIGGYVLDAFRLLPVAKSIIEFVQDDSEEPLLKVATDRRGFYSCEGLWPGIYDIKIKHPRYSPLVIKDYVVKEGENKYQDFLLHR